MQVPCVKDAGKQGRWFSKKVNSLSGSYYRQVRWLNTALEISNCSEVEISLLDAIGSCDSLDEATA